MRLVVATCALALAACGPPPSAPAPSEPPPQSMRAAPSGAGRLTPATLTLSAEAVVGRWSFDRSCGLYDLVFNADETAAYYDYADETHVVSYAGRWVGADHNRLVVTLHRLNESGAPMGDALTYTFDVSAPVTDDLVGQFGPAGGDMRNITAKRCPEEDRE